MSQPILSCVGLNIAIKREGAHQTTAGGIALPDGARAKSLPWAGRIVAVGSGYITKKGFRVACETKPGDRVLVSRLLAEDAKVAGDEYIFTTEDKVLCVLSEDARVEDMR